MDTLYKLTDSNDQTYGGCQWGIAITHTADGMGGLCSKHWIHAYRDPILAIMMNPAHGSFELETAHLWRCEGRVGVDDGTKVGCTILTTLEQMPVPKATPEQRVRFAILASLEVYGAPEYVQWAKDWLSGTGRSVAAARSARRSAAGYQAGSESARLVTNAARWIGVSLHWSADWSAYAAESAVDQSRSIDLVAIAHKAME